jgi:multidrug resistance efflux pump
MLKPEKERHQITSLFGGLVKDVRIRENQLVSENDTLVVIDPSIVVEKRNLNLQKLEETRLYIHDLNYLINHSRVVLDSLKHFNYQKGYLQFKEKIHELNTKLNKSRIDYERQSKLYEKDVIPKVEYQENKYSLEMITSELSYFKKQQIQYWQTDLTQYLTVEKELLSSLAQVEKELENYILKSPITGTIQNLIGIGIGSNLSAGNPICEISPETEIIAECYVSPSDIGLLKLNNKVKFQITSYDYNQWGMASGKVKEIGKDILNVNDSPVFKVICSIDNKELKLKNGVKGQLKKGMTLQARFFVANRSVFDLLYDKVDDWFNPANN